MKLNFSEVYFIDGKRAVKLTAFAKMINYSDKYFYDVVKNLFKKSIYIAYKWKRNYYVFLPPQTKPKSTPNNSYQEIAQTPSGDELNINWDKAIEEMPPIVAERIVSWKLHQNNLLFNFKAEGATIIAFPSSTLSPKTGDSFTPLSMGTFPNITEYTYGQTIKYKMSTFNPGTSGTLKSTQIPSAFFEICRALDAAENTRNGNNPGLPPRRNLSTTVSFDTGTISVAATLPITTSIESDGSIQIHALDYLGSTYSAFNGGGGDLNSDTLPEALLEAASFLAAVEKAVVPTENQPNNIQIQFDAETGSAVISANLPFTTLAAANGDVTIHAIDYL
ncbi:hypothetical protein NIES4075_34460 [Tolypothrix sp. NIES-4075]|uniref:hypothetical protein n=1 Tax=Tolypothrix sp. NIES-4075 TaxID=2005459 RepID=UPI000B5CDC42|nr:hypothetical protein [Tolypothrix sp. NIES-4075]GAX42445.1 hypothetical protein NIES4075_34460 [Tolypothrix sp. NIES-4075]